MRRLWSGMGGSGKCRGRMLAFVQEGSEGEQDQGSDGFRCCRRFGDQCLSVRGLSREMRRKIFLIAH